MAVRSKRLAYSWGVPAALTSLYVVPDGETALVKHITVHNTSAAGAFVLFWLTPAGGGGARLFKIVLAAGLSASVNVWWALQPDDELSTTSDVNGVVDCVIFGAELEGVAD